MELKILLKNTSYLLLTRIAKFVFGVIRLKFIAVILGPLGSGIFTQLTQITQAMSQFTLLGMNDGLVKEIAEVKGSRKEITKMLPDFVKSYIIIISVILLIVLTISLYFSNELTLYFLGNVKYNTYFLIGLVSFPILVINSISFAILKSFKEIKYIARSEILSATINIIVFLPLIYFFELTGVVVYIGLALITVLIANNYYSKKLVLSNLNISLRVIVKAKPSKKSFKELLLFAGYGLTAGLVFIVTDTLTRSIIIYRLGLDQIGLYSPILNWSALFTSFILPSIGTYLYPRYCETKTNNELVNIMNDAIRFVTLFMIPFLLLSVPIRYQVIPIFYSEEFAIAGNYLQWHFLGTLFYMWMYVFWQSMMPTGRIKTEGVLVVLMCAIDIAIVYFLVSKIGLYALMLKYLISPLIFFIFYILYFKSRIKFKLQPKNIQIMAYLILSFMTILVVEEYITPNYVINFMIGTTLTFFTFFILNKSEKDYLMQKIRRMFIVYQF